MGEDDVLTRARDLTVIPAWNGIDRMLLFRRFSDRFRGCAAKDHAFEQGVTGHSISAMQPGIADLANGIEVFNIGSPAEIGDDAPAGVVRCGHNWNRCLG